MEALKDHEYLLKILLINPNAVVGYGHYVLTGSSGYTNRYLRVWICVEFDSVGYEVAENNAELCSTVFHFRKGPVDIDRNVALLQDKLEVVEDILNEDIHRNSLG